MFTTQKTAATQMQGRAITNRIAGGHHGRRMNPPNARGKLRFAARSAQRSLGVMSRHITRRTTFAMQNTAAAHAHGTAIMIMVMIAFVPWTSGRIAINATRPRGTHPRAGGNKAVTTRDVASPSPESAARPTYAAFNGRRSLRLSVTCFS